MDNQVYQAPEANIGLESSSQFQSFNYFNWKGRIGRLRYLQLAYLLPTIIFFAYAFALILIMNIRADNAFGQTNSFDYMELLAWGLPLILITGVVNGLWLSIQRAHDMGYTGWWAMCALIPLIGTILMVIPGDASSNQYGLAPEENSPLVKVTGWLGLIGVAFYYFLIAIIFTEIF